MRSVNISIVLFLLFSRISIALSKPAWRPKRQVVQPTWLMTGGGHNLFVDSKVRVTPQNLKEAAAIRAGIQKAVADGTYVVQMPNPNNNGSQDGASNGSTEQGEQFVDPTTTTTPRQPPAIAPLWQFQFPPPGAFDAEMQQNFMRDMQRAWLNAMEYTRQMFTWNN